MDTPKQNGLSGNWGIAIGFLVLIAVVGTGAWYFAPRFYNPPPQPVAVESQSTDGETVPRVIDGETIDSTLADQGIEEPTDEQRAQIAQEIADQERAAADEAARLEAERLEAERIAAEEAAANKPGLLGRLIGSRGKKEEKKDEE